MSRQKKDRRRGMALVATLMVMLVILSVMLIGQIGTSTSGHTGVMTATTNSLTASNSRTEAVAAFNMAQSGINLATYWLSNLASPPTNTAAFAPALPGSTTTGSPLRSLIYPNPSDTSDYFTVEVYPDASNPTNTQKKYLLESVGTSSGFTQTVQAYVEQTSLSKYEVLLNRWYPSNNYWVEGLSSFDGPVHDNNADGEQENTLWLSNPGTTPPLFTYTGEDAYTVSAGGVNWYQDNYWTLGNPQSESDWASVAAGGAASVHTGTSSVSFPTAGTQQMTAALGTASAPTSTGVLIPSGGGATSAGMYIHGDVNTMVLSVGSPDTTQQIITVNQTDATGNTIVSTITITPSTKTTKLDVQKNGVEVTGDPLTYSGTTNGVVYCDGNIGSGQSADEVNPGGGTGGNSAGGLSGVVADNVVDGNGNITHANSLNISTSATGNLNFDGSVTYNTKREESNGTYVPESQDANFTEHAGVLGVMANYVTLDQYEDDGVTPLGQNFEFDGTEFAYSYCDADNWASRAVGTWENMGSYISNVVGVFGEFDGNNNLVAGFNTQFNYDQRLRDTPPPYFPTTGNQYDTISWQRVASTLQ